MKQLIWELSLLYELSGGFKARHYFWLTSAVKILIFESLLQGTKAVGSKDWTQGISSRRLQDPLYKTKSLYSDTNLN